MKAITFTKTQPCICNGSVCGSVKHRGAKVRVGSRKYTCAGCKRRLPWCFGASDSHFPYCDDCVALMTEDL